jgi:hypothetical protein
MRRARREQSLARACEQEQQRENGARRMVSAFRRGSPGDEDDGRCTEQRSQR